MTSPVGVKPRTVLNLDSYFISFTNNIECHDIYIIEICSLETFNIHLNHGVSKANVSSIVVRNSLVLELAW